jgi:hypothetical protein
LSYCLHKYILQIIINKWFMALRAIWQFMDRDVTHKILYGPKRSWGPYTILWVNLSQVTDKLYHILFYLMYLAWTGFIQQVDLHDIILRTEYYLVEVVPEMLRAPLIIYLCFNTLLLLGKEQITARWACAFSL